MSDFKVVILAYRRSREELSTGTVLLTAGGAAQTVLLSFEDLEYRKMMREFAVFLLQYPDAGGAIQRTDRPGLVQIPLSPDELALFRSDPVEAIRQRMIPPQRVVIGIDKASSPDRTVVHSVPALDAGYATLVEHFGDTVYGRARLNTTKDRKFPEVECLCCGEWSMIDNIDEKLSYTCWSCNYQLSIEDLAMESGWAGVLVKDLLQHTGREKFFIPRRWNGKNWITREDLEKRFADYNKEKTS